MKPLDGFRVVDMPTLADGSPDFPTFIDQWEAEHGKDADWPAVYFRDVNTGRGVSINLQDWRR